MHRNNQIPARSFVLLAALTLFAFPSANAQTRQFSYQGRLSDSGALANGSFDFQFKLFDTTTLGTGVQQGATLQLTNITVSDGVFTVPLDFGPCVSCFNGADRFLEIAVKLTSGSTFTPLSPRQPITSTPYALKSQNAATADGLSAACVNCITSSQIGSVSASAVTGTLPVSSVPAGSTNYIQNTSSQQASSDFNISGNGAIAGSLGIGTLSPGTRLEAVDPATQFRFGPTAADNGGYLVSTTPSQASIAGGARWNGSAWVARSTQASIIEQTSGVTRFHSNGALTPGSPFSPTQQMIITANGEVGIGVSNPLFKLEVADRMRVRNGPFGNAGIWFNQSSLDRSLVGMKDNTHVGFFGNTSAGWLLTADTTTGNVGIGTTMPFARLAVRGNGTDVLIGDAGCGPPTAAIGFGAMSGCNDFALGGDIGSSTPGTYINTFTGGRIAFRVGNTADKMTITSGGDVGIGTTSPGFKLDVADRIRVRQGPSGTAGIWFNQSATGDRAFVGMKDSVFAGFYGNAGAGWALTMDTTTGDLSQRRDSGGLVKAMAFVDPLDPGPNKILRCYNSSGSGSSTPPCGFTYSTFSGPGQYKIDFGFQVDDRFISLTPLLRNSLRAVALHINFFWNANSPDIIVQYTDNNELTHSAFWIIVY